MQGASPVTTGSSSVRKPSPFLSKALKTSLGSWETFSEGGGGGWGIRRGGGGSLRLFVGCIGGCESFSSLALLQLDCCKTLLVEDRLS